MLVNGNSRDSIKINKTLIALISLIIVIIGTLASIVAYSVGVSSTAEQAVKLATEVKNNQEEQAKQIQQNKEDIAIVNTQYKDIIRRLDSIEGKVDNLGK